MARNFRASVGAKAGTLSLSASSYSANELDTLNVTVTRTVSYDGDVAVDWALSGLSEGAPEVTSGTLRWDDQDSSSKTISLTFTSVTANRAGTLTLSSARVLRKGKAPSLGTSSASVTVLNAVGTTTLSVTPASAFASGQAVEVSVYVPPTGNITFDLHRNYDGYAHDTLLTPQTGNPAIRWTSNNSTVPSWHLDAGTRISTLGAKRPGKSSSMEMRIYQGSYGNDEDPTWGYPERGAFGGYISIPGGVGEGDDLWVGMWLYLPANWSWWCQGTPQAGSGYVKWFRWQADDAFGNKTEFEIHQNTDLWWADGDSREPGLEQGEQAGYGSYNGNLWLSEDQNVYSMSTNNPITRGGWSWVETYTKASAVSAIRRVWVNGTFVHERNGSNSKWRNWQGSLLTQTKGNFRTMQYTTDRLIYWLLCTYWNGGAPQTQSCYVQDIVMLKNGADQLTATDEFGNKMIGPGAV